MPDRRHASAGVVEPRAVAAHAAVAERQRAVIDHKLVGTELLAGLLVAGDDARDHLLARDVVADAHVDALANAEPLAPTRMVDVDRDRPHRYQLAGLPRPRKMAFRSAAEPTGEDGLQHVTLRHRSARVEIQDPCPRRPGLIVAVSARERDRQPGQVHSIGRALLDPPRQHSHANSVRRPPAGHPVDPPAGTDRIAVARLEVRAANPPAHRFSPPIPGVERLRARDRPSTLPCRRTPADRASPTDPLPRTSRYRSADPPRCRSTAEPPLSLAPGRTPPGAS